MSKRKSRSWLLKGEVVQTKGDLPYKNNIQKTHNIECVKLYWSQNRMRVKVRECKRLRVRKLHQYHFRSLGHWSYP